MDWTAKIEDTRNQLRALYKANPYATQGFATLTKNVKENGVLEFKIKEFVALGIAVATQCESCIALHVETLIKAGATREEVADVLGMTIQMGGGPILMYAAKALECYDQFAEKSAA